MLNSFFVLNYAVITSLIINKPALLNIVEFKGGGGLPKQGNKNKAELASRRKKGYLFPK